MLKTLNKKWDQSLLYCSVEHHTYQTAFVYL